jgi:alanine dehydrogenase
MLRAMRAGSVFMDVGIDQGGIGETSRITSISAPSFVDEGVLHYGVPNMPALVARTATLALSQVTLPYVRLLADRGVAGALRADADLRAGLQVWDGAIVHPALAADAGVPVAQWE